MAREVTLGRSIAMVVMRRIDEIRRLPAPGVTWKWSEVDVGGGTLQKLRDTDPALIESVEGGWETSERLADFLRARHDVELSEAGGQRTFDTPSPGSRQRTRTDGGERVASGEQVALDGEDASEALNRESMKARVEFNSASESSSPKHEEAAEDDAQATLFDSTGE